MSAVPRAPRIPKYRQHPNGQAFIEHRLIPNKSHRLYLGRFGSPESQQKYGEVIAQILAEGKAKLLPNIQAGTATINFCCVAYLEHAESYYGTKSKEFQHIKTALQGLSLMFGSMDGAEFGPKCLLKLQQHWSHVQRDGRETYARQQVNRFISLVKRMFAWVCSQELVPPEIYQRLQCVKGLRSGKCEAREVAPIKPVARQHIDAILPYLSPTVAAMVRVQYLCGMRPGEVCRMRGADLVMTGDVWLYNVARHKTTWLNRSLVKAVPRQAQAIIKAHLKGDPSLHLFSPQDAEIQRTGKPNLRRKRKIRDHYDTGSYCRAVKYGFDKLARENAKKEEAARIEIPHWHPNQLRHLIATEISQTLGQQAAQRWLGHSSLKTTEIYTEKEVAELVAIAQELERRWAS